MNAGIRTDLSGSELFMLRIGRIVVPKDDRPDWTRTWQAELWHLHHRHTRTAVGCSIPHLTFGLFFDAIWLRSDLCKRALEGTATLCLLVLAGACLSATLAGYSIPGSVAGFSAHIALFLIEAPLVIFVTFATTSQRHIHSGTSLSLHTVHEDSSSSC